MFYLFLKSFNDFMPQKAYNRIREVLREQGRTNKWLAAQLDKNEVTVSRWCRNVQQPDLETLYQIATILGIHARELLAEEVE